MVALRRTERKPRARPLIGVSAWLHQAQWHGFEDFAVVVEYRFVQKLRACGADVVVVPPPPAEAAAIADMLDGLVLSGGEDVDPAIYGGVAGPQTNLAPRERDEGDIAMIDEALQRDLPILAVCRGCQVLNVACGGTLIPHLPDHSDQVHQIARGEPGWPFTRHAVDARSPLLADLLGERFDVPSSHHQAVDALGDGLEAAGHAEDGTVEAIWDPSRRFVLGVQWHPEYEEGDELFRRIVDAAAERLAAGDASNGSAAR